MSVLKERNRRRKSGNINVFLQEGCQIEQNSGFFFLLKDIIIYWSLICQFAFLSVGYCSLYITYHCTLTCLRHCIAKRSHFGTAIGYVTWLLRLFTAIQKLLQLKEHILGQNWLCCNQAMLSCSFLVSQTLRLLTCSSLFH